MQDDPKSTPAMQDDPKSKEGGEAKRRKVLTGGYRFDLHVFPETHNKISGEKMDEAKNALDAVVAEATKKVP